MVRPSLAESAPSAVPSDHRLRPLRWLAAELRRCAFGPELATDVFGPYLRLCLYGTSELRVRVGRRDGRACFVWGAQHATHPLADPAGCARRIATELRAARGL